MVRLHTKDQLYRLAGSALKVCVVGGGGWVESEFSDRLWLSLSLALAKPKIYKAQVENPSTGDMIELLKNDFSIIEEELNETAIANTSTNSFKKFINKKIRLAAFKYLVELKESHSKVRSIEYNKLETQSYLTSPLMKILKYFLR